MVEVAKLRMYCMQSSSPSHTTATPTFRTLELLQDFSQLVHAFWRIRQLLIGMKVKQYAAVIFFIRLQASI